MCQSPKMWIVFLLISLLGGVYYVRKSKLLENSPLGIQIGRTIYTLAGDIITDRMRLDLVYLKRTGGCISFQTALTRNSFSIPLMYPEPGCSLVYMVNGTSHDLPYMEGTPFTVNKGELILYEKVKRGLTYMSVEVGRSTSWPFSIELKQFD